MPIPTSWCRVEIGELARIIGGGTPPANDRTNFAMAGAGTPWLTPADLSGYRAQYISRGARDLSVAGLAACSAKILPKGTVLFSSRAPVGYVAIAAADIATNQGFKSFVFGPSVEPRFAYYQLRHLKPVAEAMATGTTFKELSGAIAAKLPFVLAPVREQQRIADKLDTVLARVDVCRDRLTRVAPLLRRFRQSVLATATSGRLTMDWRSSEEAVTRSQGLPESWLRSTIGSAARNLDNLRVPISEILRQGRQGNYPYYGASGVIDSIDGFTHDGEFLLIGEDGANLLARSRPIAYRASGQIWVNNHAHVLTHPSTERLDFLSYAINAMDLSPYVTGSAQPKLTRRALDSIPVSIPPETEQAEIVLRVETLFAFADRLEARVQTARAVTERLTPALLAKAFRGELLPQNPADEPASELLKRLAAQREATPARLHRRRAQA